MRKTQVSTPSNDHPSRVRHGFRGTPPPPPFDLTQLPNSALLTEYEVAALARISTNTLAAWRRRSKHPLQWFTLPGGFVRYRAGDVKMYLASGAPRPRFKMPAPPRQTKPRKPSRRRFNCGTISTAADAAELQEA